MLTKEECLEALNALDDLANFTFNINREGKYYKTIYQLIKEHFDPQPYKFRELNKEMWVWDDKTKSYIYIFKPLEWEPVRGIRYASHIITNSVEGYYMDFEENRFYRREVPQEGQENE